MKKILTVVALTGALVFGGAGACDKPQPREYYDFEIPDCDEDDRVGKWDSADCGPSPTPAKTRGPVASPKPRKTR